MSIPADLVVVVGAFTIDDVVLADGTTYMATLGGNCVHSATAVVVAGASATIVARRGEDIPASAMAALAREGIDLSGIVDIPGPTLRNWVIYESDGRRRWLYRTPPERFGAMRPQLSDFDVAQLGHARVVHVTALPLHNSETIVTHVRRSAPAAVITLDTHEDWAAGLSARVLRLAQQVDVFVPSLEELLVLTGAHNPVDALHDVAAAGIRRVVLKAGCAGVYILDRDQILHVPALTTSVADTTGAGDAFCGGLAAGLARDLSLVAAVGLGAAVAGTAITGVGSLRLFDVGRDRAAIQSAGRGLAAEVAVIGSARQRRTHINEDRTAGTKQAGHNVMAQEIATLPDVVSGVVEGGDGRVRALARRLVDSDSHHLWLTGSGYSAFAASAATLAFLRHAHFVPHPLIPVDMARYRAPYLPPESTILALSFAGTAGGITEAVEQSRKYGAYVIAVTDDVDSPFARASDETLLSGETALSYSSEISSYLAMLATLLTLAGHLAELRGDRGRLRAELARLPEQVAATLDGAADATVDVAQTIRSAAWVILLGAGPNEATARFGGARLSSGGQRLGIATNLDEWGLYKQHLVERPGTPVVLMNPTGAARDRGAEVLSELGSLSAVPVLVSDRPIPEPVGGWILPIAPDVSEELSPVTACLPLALLSSELTQPDGAGSAATHGIS